VVVQVSLHVREILLNDIDMVSFFALRWLHHSLLLDLGKNPKSAGRNRTRTRVLPRTEPNATP